MAEFKGPRKPFFARGVWWASQSDYREMLAQEAGFASRAERDKKRAEMKKLVVAKPGNLTDAQQGVLAAGLADYQGRIGSFVETGDIAKRGSNLLPRELQVLIREMGDAQYPIWRLLYR